MINSLKLQAVSIIVDDAFREIGAEVSEIDT